MSDLFSSEWSDALGWTLLHSIWQSAIVLLLTLASFRFISARRSEARYAIACGGMLLFALTAMATFFSLMDNSNPYAVAAVGHVANGYVTVSNISEPPNAWFPDQVIRVVAAAIEGNMSWILLLWATGFVFFSMRFSAALYYTRQLQTSSTLLANDWNTYITNATARLGIRRIVGLAQSAVITSPMVIGYLKPVILVPAGMLTGLTAEQLETIFLHELAHIRRHDYLVNLAQSFIEVIFFFNPFVWIQSKIIRREREYCCDDLVVRHHGGTRAYAHALVQLAEASLTAPRFALSLADDKNQLLNRIKRIMENSVKNYSGKGRLAIPVILLFMALACISWLGTDDKNSVEPSQHQSDAFFSADTVPSKKGSASYSRKSIITMDENGRPHEEVVEEFEGDESLRPLIGKQFHGFSGMTPPGFPQFPAFAVPNWSDTIPPAHGFKSDEWEAYARSLTEELQKQLKMLEEFPHDSLMQGFADKWNSFEMPHPGLRRLEKFEHAEILKQLEEKLGKLHGFDFDEFAHPGHEFSPSKGYEEALREQLLKDGYLDKDESIQSLEWSKQSFKVNGESIDRADREKYRKLNDEFFGTSEKRK